MLRSRDLVLLGGPHDNAIVARLGAALGLNAPTRGSQAPVAPSASTTAATDLAVPVQLGDGFFRFRETLDADSGHGLFLALPSPFAADRLVWLFAGNSALALHDMTKNNIPGLPAWALFQGDAAKEQGYLPVARFVFAGPPET
jgi:hypothetical protein